MHARFLHPGPFEPGTKVELTGEEAHHASRVIRVRPGETVELFDGAGAMAEAVVLATEKTIVSLNVVSTIHVNREQPVEIVLAPALIALDRFELVLQKGVELGITRFVPTITERVETRIERVSGKHARWERIILEAAKQCGRAFVPSLAEPTGFDDVIRGEGSRIVFDADEEPSPWPDRAEGRITILIGPEGGWSGNELIGAREAGCAFRRLGARRLRAETASIVAATLIGSRFGDLGA